MRLKSILLVVSTVAVVACSSDGDVRRQEYLDADYYTRLELPPNLTEPASAQQLSIPKPTDAVLEKFKTDTQHLGKSSSNGNGNGKSTALAANTATLPLLKGVALKTEAGQSWLEVASSAQQVWPQLVAFWDHEGIPIVKNQPLLSTIETDWVSQLQEKIDAGWLEKIFNKIEPERLDKFRMRVQTAAGADKTRVYVSHSGMEQVVVDDSDYLSWRARCSEAGLEQEILSRLALFLGLDAKQAKAALADYRPYASRVSVVRVGDGSDSTEFTPTRSTLYLNSGLSDAWARTQLALDRIGAEILEADRTQHQFKIALNKQVPVKVDEERDEIAESSWLMQWFKGNSTSSDAGSQFLLAMAAEPERVKLSILELDGRPASGDQAELFRQRLIRELQ